MNKTVLSKIMVVVIIIIITTTGCEVVEQPFSTSLTTVSDNHTNSINNVHGVAGNIVGTTDTQNLTNKTLGATTMIGILSMQSNNLTGTNYKIASGGEYSIQFWNGAGNDFQYVRAKGFEINNQVNFYATPGQLRLLDGSNTGYLALYTRQNGTNNVEVARAQSATGDGYFQLTKTPKFLIQSVSGPTNNVTPVNWLPVILSDGTTGFLPIYK